MESYFGLFWGANCVILDIGCHFGSCDFEIYNLIGSHVLGRKPGGRPKILQRPSPSCHLQFDDRDVTLAGPASAKDFRFIQKVYFVVL